MTGFVYFVERGDAIKIGYAANPVRRLGELQASSPEPIRLVVLLPGSPASEHEYHRRFSDDRIRGEWFRRSPALLAYVATQDVPVAMTDTKAWLRANADRQRQHYEKMKAAGFKKVAVYVPKQFVARLNAYAARLRKESK